MYFLASAFHAFLIDCFIYVFIESINRSLLNDKVIENHCNQNGSKIVTFCNSASINWVVHQNLKAFIFDTEETAVESFIHLIFLFRSGLFWRRGFGFVQATLEFKVCAKKRLDSFGHCIKDSGDWYSYSGVYSKINCLYTALLT